MSEKEHIDDTGSGEPRKKKRLTKQQKSYIFYIALIVIVSALTIYCVLGNNFFDVIDAIKKADIFPILIMLGLVLLSFICEGLILTVFARLYQRRYHLYQGICNGLIGVFFSDITPFASGGQFVQAYTFSKQGVKVANSASILVMHFIVFQTIVVLYGTVAFIFGYNSVIKVMGNTTILGLSVPPIALSIIGFIINIFTICSLFFLAYCKPLHRFILNTGINLGAKLHLIKDPEKKRQNLTVQVATFRIELKRLMSNAGALVTVVVILIVKMTLMNSLPYFSGLALGEDMSGKYFNCLWSTSYLTMITSFIPIPGASGGAELAYQMLFSHIYSSQALLSASNLLWRGISFYFGLVLGGIIFFAYHESPKSYAIKADTRTFIDLEIVALANSTKEEETYKALSARDKRRRERFEEERERSRQLLDAEAVKESFESINKSLIFSRPETENPGDYDPHTYERTKKFLRRVVADTERQEQENAADASDLAEEIKQDSLAIERAKARRKKKSGGRKK